MTITEQKAPIRIDLHCHSNLSDGQLTPEQLVMRAAQMQLDYLALTDHDAVAGVERARSAAQAYGKGAPDIISGVEFSCQWQGFEIHILGWHFDVQHPAMTRLVTQQQQTRRDRAAAIGAKLVKQGVAAEHLPPPVEGQVLTRAHFAAALQSHGYVSSVQDAFRRYLGKGQCAYVPTPWCSIDEAIAAIQAAGGFTGLAHPLAYQLSSKWLKRLIVAFKEAGGEAMEVASGQQEPKQRQLLAQLAQDYDLAASVGSDFHYPGRWRELGRNLTLPAECRPIWASWNLA
ncbi:PHP domain-containing protein [Aliidiomarina taiwanensis]|uniref:PHP domain-containing protein n=1 Tax=Aliidiomarina taiwanensis TaxID=946228 RepID=UPI001F544780|nr:PHP domain-containing protein [Aliidiomarina taiwanensis]